MSRQEGYGMKVILCCTGTDSFEDWSLADVDKWHQSKGYKQAPDGFCKWTYVIKRNGEVQQGRIFDGYHNSKYEEGAIMLGLVGKPENFSIAQHKALRALWNDIKQEYIKVIPVSADDLPINDLGFPVTYL